VNKDLEEYISKRCEKALMDNAKFKELQELSLKAYLANDIKSYSEINTSIATLIESTCYKLALSDFIELSTNKA
jgi:hypothetical protein